MKRARVRLTVALLAVAVSAPALPLAAQTPAERERAARQAAAKLQFRPADVITVAEVTVRAEGTAAPAPRPAPAETLVPASNSQVQDSQGFRWDLNSNGMINNGSNAFSGAMMLMVNGSQFSGNQFMSTADGSEYVLTQQLNGLNVTRRIHLDQARAAARYLEVLENPSDAPVTVALAVRTHLSTNVQQVITSTGQPFTGKLGRKDVGIVTLSMHNHIPNVMWIVGEGRHAENVAINLQHNQIVTFTWNLTIKPKETASVLHYVAQRTMGTIHAANAEEQFKPFHRNRLVKPLVPRHLRGTVVNFNLGGDSPELAMPRLPKVVEVLEAMGVERSVRDIVHLEDEATLEGTVTAADLTVRTVFGETTVSLADVALLRGGSSAGTPGRVYLRNGEVLAGNVLTPQMSLRTEEGLELALRPEALRLMVMRADPRDGEASPGTVAFVDTHVGDRLALAASEATVVRGATPWGLVEAPLGEVAALTYSPESQPRHRLTLRDQTSLTLIPTGDELALESLRFGTLRLSPHALAGIVSLGAARTIATGEDEPGELFEEPAPFCRLVGENALAAGLELAELRVLTPGGVTVLKPEQVVTIARSDEESSDGRAWFEFQLVAGGTLVGRLEERVLPLRGGGRLWQVPAAHLVAYRAQADPAATQPAAEAEARRATDPADELSTRVPTITVQTGGNTTAYPMLDLVDVLNVAP